MDKIKLVKTCFNLFVDKLVRIDQNMSYLLKIRKVSQEEDQKASPRSAIEDLADNKRIQVFIVCLDGDTALGQLAWS